MRSRDPEITTFSALALVPPPDVPWKAKAARKSILGLYKPLPRLSPGGARETSLWPVSLLAGPLRGVVSEPGAGTLILADVTEWA